MISNICNGIYAIRQTCFKFLLQFHKAMQGCLMIFPIIELGRSMTFVSPQQIRLNSMGANKPIAVQGRARTCYGVLLLGQQCEQIVQTSVSATRSERQSLFIGGSGGCNTKKEDDGISKSQILDMAWNALHCLQATLVIGRKSR